MFDQGCSSARGTHRGGMQSRGECRLTPDTDKKRPLIKLCQGDQNITK